MAAPTAMLTSEKLTSLRRLFGTELWPALLEFFAAAGRLPDFFERPIEGLPYRARRCLHGKCGERDFLASESQPKLVHLEAVTRL